MGHGGTDVDSEFFQLFLCMSDFLFSTRDPGFDRSEELLRLEGLGEEVVGPQFHSFPRVGRSVSSRKKDEGNYRRRGVFPEHMKYFKPVEPGHFNITQDEIRNPV